MSKLISGAAYLLCFTSLMACKQTTQQSAVKSIDFSATRVTGSARVFCGGEPITLSVIMKDPVYLQAASASFVTKERGTLYGFSINSLARVVSEAEVKMNVPKRMNTEVETEINITLRQEHDGSSMQIPVQFVPQQPCISKTTLTREYGPGSPIQIAVERDTQSPFVRTANIVRTGDRKVTVEAMVDNVERDETLRVQAWADMSMVLGELKCKARPGGITLTYDCRGEFELGELSVRELRILADDDHGNGSELVKRLRADAEPPFIDKSSIRYNRSGMTVEWSYTMLGDAKSCSALPESPGRLEGRRCSGSWNLETTVFDKDRHIAFQAFRADGQLMTEIDDMPTETFDGARFDGDTQGTAVQIK